MFLRRLLAPVVVASTALACVASVPESEGDQAITAEELASETAVITLLGTTTQVAYVNVAANATKPLSDALIATAKRGVDVHVLLSAGKAGSHDSTWLLQQHLESSGVDVDVRTDAPVSGVVMVSDSKALVGGKTVTTPSIVSRYLQQFVTAMAGNEPKPGSLLGAGVVVWAMPDASRDRIVQLFDAAHISIDLEIYQLQERRVAKALMAAAARGVKVRVMLEPKTVGAANFTAMSTELAKAGIVVKQTPPAFDSHHNVDHAKFAILDGKELLFGTGNLVRSGLGGVTEGAFANRDFWVEDARATSVSEAKKLFEADFAQQPTRASDLPDLVVTPDNASAKIAALIDGATKRLHVYNQSLDDADLLARLIAAKKRGVDVRVLLGYQPGFGGPPANQAALDQLAAAKIEAHFLKRHYLHAKAIVADGTVYLGSQNFTNGGLHNNREFGEIVNDATAVKVVEDTFGADLAKPE